MRKTDIPVPVPCHEDWSGMDGGEQKRFCDQCTKHVHNLSEMTEPQARALLSARNETLCVRYEARQDGSIRFKPSRRAVLAAAAVLATSASAEAAMMVASPDEEGREPGFFRRLLRRLRGQPEAVEPVAVEEIIQGEEEVVETLGEPVLEDPEIFMGDYDPDWVTEE